MKAALARKAMTVELLDAGKKIDELNVRLAAHENAREEAKEKEKEEKEEEKAKEKSD